MNTPGTGGNGLPDLPPEWGRVVVPDDASALAQEAAQVRRELRERARLAARRRFGALRQPLVWLVVAVLLTLAGLAAVTRPGPTATPAEGASSSPATLPAAPIGRPLPALDLVDTGQNPVPLRSLLPMMIILVDGCACPERVSEAAAAAPPQVNLVAVTGGRSAPSAPPGGSTGTRTLADPAGGLRSFLHLSPRPDAAVAVLVDRSGTVVRVLPQLGPIETYRADLTALAA
ncbi:hypothetical protein ABZ814_10215 [Micromonospora musae]|uniref:hypothetical protein n=1 Tax=Micromonospora musae TaxID=1894970 RepID=UPI0033E349BF